MIHICQDDRAPIGRPISNPRKKRVCLTPPGPPPTRRLTADLTLQRLGRLTAARLAEECSIPHYAASQALRDLWSRGRARRERESTPEGAYYVYEVLQ